MSKTQQLTYGLPVPTADTEANTAGARASGRCCVLALDVEYGRGGGGGVDFIEAFHVAQCEAAGSYRFLTPTGGRCLLQSCWYFLGPSGSEVTIAALVALFFRPERQRGVYCRASGAFFFFSCTR